MLTTNPPARWDPIRAARHLTRLDPARPRLERVLDATLGGKNNFAADRGMAIRLVNDGSLTALRSLQAIPRFYQRIVKHLLLEGIDQIILVGSGVPTGLPPGRQLHDLAHADIPTTRIVYAESDPLILAAARATIEPASDLIRILEGDVRDLQSLLADPVLATFLDWEAPVGMVLGCLHALTGDQHLGLPGQLRRVMAAGSHLAIMQITRDHHQASGRPTVPDLIGSITPRPVPRTLDQLRPMFADLELLEPGIVSISHWRPDPETALLEPPATGIYGALARLP